MWQLQRLLQRLLTLNFVGVSAPPQMKIYIKTAEIVQVDNMFLGEKIIDEQHIHRNRRNSKRILCMNRYD